MNALPLSISVILCAYSDDRWDDLQRAVTSVQMQELAPREIIVVIDHNPALLRRAQQQWPHIRVIENSETRGLSGARNTGIAAATSDIVAFLDDDAVAAPDWLRWLIQAYADERVLGVGGQVLPAWATDRPAWFPVEFDWVVGCTFHGMPITRQPVQRLIGANMSFRRQLFAVIGGFRSHLGRVGTRPLAGEETEWCIRARQQWPQRYFVFEPHACVAHRVPENRATWEYFRSRCYCEGLSKALVSRHVGAIDALDSERRYTFRVLPISTWRNFVQAVRHRDPQGLARAGAIIAGLSWTISGYLAGNVAGRTPSVIRRPRLVYREAA